MRGGSNIAALILAAGYSTRSSGFKPLLPLGGSTVLEKAVACFRRAGIEAITAVTGHRSEDLAPVLDVLGVRRIYNEHHDKGMFSSVVTGVAALPPGTEAFFLLPADMPLVSSHTVRMLSRHYNRTGAAVTYPVFQGMRGHPPLISARLRPAIAAWQEPGGLRQLLAQYEADVCDVEVVDEGVLVDIDTPEDYTAALDSYCRRHIPSDGVCTAIFQRLAVPDPLASHGRMVAAVAGRLAGSLNEAGLNLDLRLVMAAGLLHDVAKGRPGHARYGAKLLKSLGYPEVAVIVAAHTDIILAEGFLLDEAAIVYLADKLVKQDRLVSLYERFQASLEKFATDADALAAAKERLAKAQAIVERIEQTLGAKLEKMMAAEGFGVPADPER